MYVETALDFHRWWHDCFFYDNLTERVVMADSIESESDTDTNFSVFLRGNTLSYKVSNHYFRTNLSKFNFIGAFNVPEIKAAITINRVMKVPSPYRYRKALTERHLRIINENDNLLGLPKESYSSLHEYTRELRCVPQGTSAMLRNYGWKTRLKVYYNLATAYQKLLSGEYFSIATSPVLVLKFNVRRGGIEYLYKGLPIAIDTALSDVPTPEPISKRLSESFYFSHIYSKHIGGKLCQ